MKKNLIIGLLTVISILSLAYGYIQKQRADEQEALAIENGKLAREAQIIAEQNMKEAEMQKRFAFEAMRQKEIAEKTLSK